MASPSRSAKWFAIGGVVVICLVALVAVLTWNTERRSAPPASVLDALPTGLDHGDSKTFPVQMSGFEYRYRVAIIENTGNVEDPKQTLVNRLLVRGWNAPVHPNWLTLPGEACVSIHARDETLPLPEADQQLATEVDEWLDEQDDVGLVVLFPAC